jgi:hypothetical protein
LVEFQVHEVLGEVEVPARARRRRWISWSEGGCDDDTRVDAFNKGLDQGVLEPVRVVLQRRAEAVAALADLALTVEGIGPRKPR